MGDYEELYPTDAAEPFDLGDGTLVTYFRHQHESDIDEKTGEKKIVSRPFYHPLTVQDHSDPTPTEQPHTPIRLDDDSEDEGDQHQSKDVNKKRCLVLYCEVGDSSDTPEKPFTFTCLPHNTSLPPDAVMMNYFPDSRHLKPVMPNKFFRLCLCGYSRALYMASGVDDLVLSVCPFESAHDLLQKLEESGQKVKSTDPTKRQTPLEQRGPLFGDEGDDESHENSNTTPSSPTSGTAAESEQPKSGEEAPKTNDVNNGADVPAGYRVVVEHRGDGWVRFFDCEYVDEAASFKHFAPAFAP